MSTFLTRHLPALAWGVLTASALLMQGDQLQEVEYWFGIPDWLWPWADKLVHFGLFFVLAWLVSRCFSGTDGDPDVERRTLVVTLPYIVVLEAAQIRIPGRGWETLDVVAGFAGAAVALVLARLARDRTRA